MKKPNTSFRFTYWNDHGTRMFQEITASGHVTRQQKEQILAFLDPDTWKQKILDQMHEAEDLENQQEYERLDNLLEFNPFWHFETAHTNQHPHKDMTCEQLKQLILNHDRPDADRIMQTIFSF